MTIRLKTFTLGFVYFLLVSPVMAEEFVKLRTSYFSISTGQSRTLGTCVTSLVAGATCKEGGEVYRIAIGHYFTPAWGMEFSYGDFGKGRENGVFAVPPLPAVGGPAPYIWSWKAIGWELAGVGTARLSKSFSMTGKVGILRASYRDEVILQAGNGGWIAVFDDGSKVNLSASVGTQYDFNNDVAASIQYANYGKIGGFSKIKTSAVTASLVLKF